MQEPLAASLLGSVILGMTLSYVSSFPEGPPLSVCQTMSPGVQPGETGLEGHLEASQNLVPTFGNSRTPPYFIQVHSEIYTPGQKVYVSVVANQTMGLNMYKGILMQARRHLCTSNETIQVGVELIGKFHIIPNSGKPAGESLLTTKDCLGLEQSAVAHKSPQFKINETVIWEAPDEMAGNIVFRATIVQNSHIYWVDVTSPVLLDPSADEPPTCGSSTLFTCKTLILALSVTLIKAFL